MNRSTGKEERYEDAGAAITIGRRRAIKAAVADIRTRYGITDRAMTEADFYRICAGKGIELADTDEFRQLTTMRPSLRGLAFTDLKAIYLACFFVGEFDLFAAAHELGHVTLGHQGLAFSDLKTYSDSLPDEREANYFADLLMRATFEFLI